MNIWEMMAETQKHQEQEILKTFSENALMMRWNFQIEKEEDDERRIKRRHFSVNQESIFNIKKLTECEIKTVVYYLSLLTDDFGYIDIVKEHEKESLIALLKKYENIIKPYDKEYKTLTKMLNTLSPKPLKPNELMGSGL